MTFIKEPASDGDFLQAMLDRSYEEHLITDSEHQHYTNVIDRLFRSPGED